MAPPKRIIDHLIKIGCQPIAVGEDKSPMLRGWAEPEYEIDQPWELATNIGIRLGVTNHVAIDIDYINPDQAWEVVERILSDYPNAPVKLAPSGRGATVIVRTLKPFRTKKGPKTPAGRIELLGISRRDTASQTVIWGPHPNGGEYEQFPSIFDWQIPLVSVSWLKEILPPVVPKPPKVKAWKAKVDPKSIVKVLEKLDPDDYDFWLAVGMALHDHDSSNESFDLWHEWSKKGSTYTNERECRYKWETFTPGEGLTIQWLMQHDTTHGDELCEAYFGFPREPYTIDEWEKLAKKLGLPTGDKLTRNVMINCGSSDYYVLSPKGWKGPDRGDGVLLRMKQVSAAAPWVQTKTENGKLLTVAALKESYCTAVVSEIQYSTHYESSFLDGEVLTVSAPDHREIKPQRSRAVESWLASLTTNEALPYLLDWLATCLKFDQPAPMLYLQGEAERGKSFLAYALADYFYCGPTPSSIAFGSYNDDIRKNPFVLLDEELPKDSRGNEMLDRLKDLVTSRQMPLNQKYGKITKLEGAIRLIFCSNPNKLLTRQAVTFEQDVKALADRLTHIPVVPGPVLPQRDANLWIKDKTLLKHVKWLEQERPVEQGRLICRSNGYQTAEAVAITSPWVSHVLRFITESVENKKDTHGAIKIENGKVLVNGRLLNKFTQTSFGRSSFPDERALATAVFPRIAHAYEKEIDNRRLYKGRQYRYRVIKEEAIIAWLSLMDRDVEHWHDSLEEYEEKFNTSDVRELN